MVSIIIPIYNSAEYLARCIESIFRQIYTDWELFLIDDGSTDASPSLCDDYGKKDERIKVYHQKNNGASMARKKGIELARGEWVTFVDSDDIVEDDYIKRLLDCAVKHGVDIAACDQMHHREGDDCTINKVEETKLLEETELHKMFFKYHFWGFWGKIYHRSVFEGIYFPQYTINEDYVVMAQLFYKYKKIGYVPQGLYHYMRHNDSLSNQKLGMRMFDEYYNKLWVRDFYKNNSKYLQQAEAQLTETCIKLIGSIKRGEKKGQYNAELETMQLYLKTKLLSIFLNRYLNLGLKYMACVSCLP